LITSIITLEREADRKRLPNSILAFNQDKLPLASASQATLYQTALPRLVTLIDRSEFADPVIADQAGELLADLNATQHEVPEALKTETPAQPAASAPQPAPVPTVAGPVALSRRHDFASLKPEYGQLFDTAAVREQNQDTINWYLAMMRKSRERYAKVGDSVGVPWHFIAVIHGLEASFNFKAHLHNGDYPLSARTRQVPPGRPLVWLPPADWESSAKDALRLLGFTGQKDWSLERTLYRLEAYNGFGYRKRGVPTPYLWSFSNHYERGKFVSDGSFNPKARSQQCGAAVNLKVLADAGEVKFG
jgi:lysozyme family protein